VHSDLPELQRLHLKKDFWYQKMIRKNWNAPLHSNDFWQVVCFLPVMTKTILHLVTTTKALYIKAVM